MKSKKEIVECLKEMNLIQEDIDNLEISDYPEEFINKGWIEALNWVLELRKYG
tara:strand:- start:1040 stop:1198 length:159 start_codon:yes stop_codon:yes gene_type:complete